MTTISWDGGPILKGGAVGTEQACCCGCAPCCIDGTRVAGPLYDTQAECEAEGGVWIPTLKCSPLPECQAFCVCNDVGAVPQICIDGVCTDIDISATWCGMTVTTADSFKVVDLDPDYDCGNGNVVGAMYFSISWYCETVCNCVLVTAVVGVMSGSGATGRTYTAKRWACGDSLNASDMAVTMTTDAPGVCGDAWYGAAGCDVAPTITINFAP